MLTAVGFVPHQPLPPKISLLFSELEGAVPYCDLLSAGVVCMNTSCRWLNSPPHSRLDSGCRHCEMSLCAFCWGGTFHLAFHGSGPHSTLFCFCNWVWRLICCSLSGKFSDLLSPPPHAREGWNEPKDSLKHYCTFTFRGRTAFPWGHTKLSSITALTFHPQCVYAL